MAKPGRQMVTRVLPGLKHKYKFDLVLAQAENVTHGVGMSPSHMKELQDLGIDVFTGGNHSVERPDLRPILDDTNQPALAPANMYNSKFDWGHKVIKTAKGDVLVASLLGDTVPKPLSGDNPLKTIDKILEVHKDQQFVAKIVNFHGDYSSEKRVIGYYLDGQVSAVIGDHWHVPTADAMVLPHGTAHITDVGMCGTMHSSLGVRKETIMARWKEGVANKNDIAEEGPYQFNAVMVVVDTKTGLAKSIERIGMIIDK